MTHCRSTVSLLVLAACIALPCWGAVLPSFGQFRELSMIYELNETDGDAEVVIVAKASEGMSQLSVTDPGGKKIVDFRARDRRQVGQEQFKVESAEPAPNAVRAAFPEGAYTFEARTVSGERLLGVVLLGHALLPAPAFSPDEDEVDPDGVVVSWSPVPGVAAYLLEIEQDEIGFNLTTRLGAGVTSFAVPAGILLAGVEYELGVASVTAAGNVAVAESSFTTTGD